MFKDERGFRDRGFRVASTNNQHNMAIQELDNTFVGEDDEGVFVWSSSRTVKYHIAKKGSCTCSEVCFQLKPLQTP